MPRCDVCGTALETSHQCIECGGVYCGSHRLPESHACAALEEWRDPMDVTEDGRGSRPAEDRRGATTDEDESGLDAALARVQGTVTYAFLALMGATFLAQTVVVPLAGYPPTSRVWMALFVVSSDHPEYVWTWFSSIFAHGGLFHLAINAVVVFFFGRLVEEYLGAVRYALLFLGAGAVAGLAQISVAFAGGGETRAALGASGAALAILGLLTAINPRLRVYLFFLIPIPLWLFTGGYGAYTVYRIGSGGVGAGGVGQLAHLTGLVVAFGYGLYLRARRDRRPRELGWGSVGDRDRG